jgi:hypothetical protein
MVRVFERAGDPRLAQEIERGGGVLLVALERLDRDHAPERGLFGEPDDAHPALADGDAGLELSRCSWRKTRKLLEHRHRLAAAGRANLGWDDGGTWLLSQGLRRIDGERLEPRLDIAGQSLPGSHR